MSLPSSVGQVARRLAGLHFHPLRGLLLQPTAPEDPGPSPSPAPQALRHCHTAGHRVNTEGHGGTGCPWPGHSLVRCVGHQGVPFSGGGVCAGELPSGPPPKVSQLSRFPGGLPREPKCCTWERPSHQSHCRPRDGPRSPALEGPSGEVAQRASAPGLGGPPGCVGQGLEQRRGLRAPCLLALQDVPEALASSLAHLTPCSRSSPLQTMSQKGTPGASGGLVITSVEPSQSSWPHPDPEQRVPGLRADPGGSNSSPRESSQNDRFSIRPASMVPVQSLPEPAGSGLGFGHGHVPSCLLSKEPIIPGRPRLIAALSGGLSRAPCGLGSRSTMCLPSVAPGSLAGPLCACVCAHACAQARGGQADPPRLGSSRTWSSGTRQRCAWMTSATSWRSTRRSTSTPTWPTAPTRSTSSAPCRG